MARFKMQTPFLLIRQWMLTTIRKRKRHIEIMAQNPLLRTPPSRSQHRLRAESAITNASRMHERYNFMDFSPSLFREIPFNRTAFLPHGRQTLHENGTRADLRRGEIE